MTEETKAAIQKEAEELYPHIGQTGRHFSQREGYTAGRTKSIEEIESLKRRIASYKMKEGASEKIIAHQSKLLSEAKTVDSEREANEILTNENEKLKAENERLKEENNRLTMDNMTHEYNQAEAEKYAPEFERQIREDEREKMKAENERLRGLIEKIFKGLNKSYLARGTMGTSDEITRKTENSWQQFCKENGLQS